MEQLIKDLELIWESYKEHDEYARVDQMVNCINSIVSTCEIIKHKCINTLIELR